MLRVEPGREREFEIMRSWLQASAAVEDAIAAGEPPVPDAEFLRKPLPPSLRRAYARPARSQLTLPPTVMAWRRRRPTQARP